MKERQPNPDKVKLSAVVQHLAMLEGVGLWPDHLPRSWELATIADSLPDLEPYTIGELLAECEAETFHPLAFEYDAEETPPDSMLKPDNGQGFAHWFIQEGRHRLLQVTFNDKREPSFYIDGEAVEFLPAGECASVIKLAAALCEKLRVVINSPEYGGIWSFLHVHGQPYTGPDFGKELAALEQALGIESTEHNS